MIRTAARLALLFSSVALVAQNSAPSGSATFGVDRQLELESESQTHALSGFTVITYPTMACPIDMHARQGLWDRTVRVRDGEKERVLQPFGQRISLDLKDSRPARIVAATVRVHGLNGKNRMVLTPTDTTQRWNAVKTLKVNFAEQKDGTVSADLWIGGFTSVSSIQLMDVSYSDGSIWKISRSNACRVQPDPLMLITER